MEARLAGVTQVKHIMIVILWIDLDQDSSIVSNIR